MSEWLLATGWIVAFATAALARVRLTARAEAVADACHELRGPLTSARLGLDLAARVGGLSSDQVRALELELERATLALEDFRGESHRRNEFVDVRELLVRSVEAWRPAAAAGLHFQWRGDRAWVIGDRLRLAQATGNLLANAIEHGGGRVEVVARFRDGVVRIEVLDDGRGLPAPVAELIGRRGRAGKRVPHGRGRGLSIVSGIAAAHGGRLSAAPAAGGARVVLTLPALDSADRGRRWPGSQVPRRGWQGSPAPRKG